MSSEQVERKRKEWASFLYAAWRFRVWAELGTMTYEQIDQAVRDGKIVPGDSVEEVKAALEEQEMTDERTQR